jgi:hypothetical protein
MSQRVDKDSLPLDKPRRTPGHPTKSHIVKTRVDGKEKIIRFGEQGASTAGKPKEGESERMKAKRASFKSRHAKNIAKGKSSPAYWANKVKWADGGPVELLDMAAKYDEGGDVDVMDYLRSVGGTLSSLPNVPAALYDVGKRAVQAAPEAARSALQYIQRSTPQEVAQDVRGGLSAVGRQVRDNPLSTIADFIPVVGDIKAYGEDVARAAAMRARGDVRGAQGVEQFAIPMAMASILPGVGEARKAVIRSDDVFRGVGTPKITVEQTDKPFVVRTTTQDQIDDMIASGLVRPKPGGYGKQQSPQIYFGESETAEPSGVFGRPAEGGFAIVGKSGNLVGKEGPISLDQLEHIWENRGGELVDILPDIIRRNQEFAPASPLTEIKAGIKTGAKAEFPVRFGVPQGGVNLRPSVDPVTLKGPDVQTVESFVNQLRGQPGMTKQGLQNLLAAYEDPSEVMTKAKFGERIPGSQYDIVELGTDVSEGVDIDDDLYEEARDLVSQNIDELFSRVADQNNLPVGYGRYIEDIYRNGFDPQDPDHLRTAEIIRSRYPGQDVDVGNVIQDEVATVYDDELEQVLEEMREDGGFSSSQNEKYAFTNIQRLVKYNDPEGYFEIGLTNPNVTDRYKHFPGKDNLAGHIRGTLMGENPEYIISGGDYGPNVFSKERNFKPKPNSMVIEELQSDVQKGAEATGPLHQIHATLFKGAVQRALEQGANTVYLPTAKTIGIARGKDPAKYAAIYDQEVIKYGLNPLKDIPGVEVNPINDMYYEINFAPEAKDYILKGKGQKAPGFAKGGLVDYDSAHVDSIIDGVLTGKYAQGGLVQYDPKAIDDIVNQIHEGMYG